MGQPAFLYALSEASLDSGGKEIGEANYQIPLPWIAMFRVKDIIEVTEEFEEDEEGPLTYYSVCTKMDEAKENLHSAAELVSQEFPEAPRLPGYFEIMIEELEQFDFPYIGIEAACFNSIGSLLEDRSVWEKCLLGYDSLEAAKQLIPITILDQIKSFLGIPRRKRWEPRGFDEYSLKDELPPADYMRQKQSISKELRIRHAQLLPRSVYHHSVWEIAPKKS